MRTGMPDISSLKETIAKQFDNLIARAPNQQLKDMLIQRRDEAYARLE